LNFKSDPHFNNYKESVHFLNHILRVAHSKDGNREDSAAVTTNPRHPFQLIPAVPGVNPIVLNLSHVFS
jgi:hypothetical protein